MSVRLKDSISGPLNGNANTATTLQTARSINGTNFNGSANITTANWGTARTLTIGSTGKSVNGSGNISWSLSEIGAAAASHNHNYLPLSGGKLTGNVELIKSVANAETNYVATRNDTGHSVWLGIGEGGVNHGIYSRTLNKWIAYADANSIYLNGNASTATTLKTARTINGTSFNGSANITTANWGTARTITIGKTGKSVNGSANVSWSLSEIGAAAASHNHTSLSGVTKIAFNAESTDAASISTTVSGTNTYFDFNLSDDPAQNDQWRWRFSPSGGTVFNAMILDATSTTEANLSVVGTIYSKSTRTNVLAGNSDAYKFYVGHGTCRIDTASNYFRVFTSKIGANDNGIRIDPNGGISFMVNSVGKHAFNTNGTKTGGTMEIEGITYGMSPTDSPQTLIEYIEYDIEVNYKKEIQLDPIYSKMISKYAVFSSNPDVKIISKEKDYFIVEGNGIADFVIKGQRKNADEHFRIMGGFNHGTEEEVCN